MNELIQNSKNFCDVVVMVIFVVVLTNSCLHQSFILILLRIFPLVILQK